MGKKFIYIILGMLIVFIMSSCTKDTINNIEKPSSYDGEYLSFGTIVENKNEPLFIIKDGKLNGDKIQGDIDEVSKKITIKKQNYRFLYSKGEMTILDKEGKVWLKGYRKGTQSYNSIDEVYGEYARVVVPNLRKVIETNIKDLVPGDYERVDAESTIKNITIYQKNLDADFRGESVDAKNEKLSLKNITINQPMWDKDLNSSINRKILREYSQFTTLEKIVKNVDFSLTFNINNLKTEYIVIHYNSDKENEYPIKVKSKSILGDNLVDDVYKK